MPFDSIKFENFLFVCFTSCFNFNSRQFFSSPTGSDYFLHVQKGHGDLGRKMDLFEGATSLVLQQQALNKVKLEHLMIC